MQGSLFGDEDKIPEWMQKLWEWADQFNISNKDLPRDKHKLLKKRNLDLMLVYFGVNKISKDQWPGKISLLSEEEKNSFSKSLIKKGSFPEEIGRLIRLEKLCINYNFIERLPESIVNLKNIKQLCLCGNKHLVLTARQKHWIFELEKNGATIECDEDLMYRKIEEITIS